jgi:GNAT superfamily N-acetyltransferase
MEVKKGQFTISDDKTLLSYDLIFELLSKTYWAHNRSLETIVLTIDNSHCYGMYYNEEQIGFARVVSDFATVFWLGDVVVSELYRGKGLGKWFIDTIINSPELSHLSGILATEDAQQLYARFGFKSEPERLMRLVRSTSHKNTNR